MSEYFAVHRHDGPAGRAWLVVSGEVEADTGETLSALITDAAEQPGTTGVVVDLRQVSFLDAGGIRALLVGREVTQQHGRSYQVANPHGVVRRVLAITGLLEILDVINVETGAGWIGPLEQPPVSSS